MATPTSLPASFTSGQVLTAAQMNNLRGAFRVLQVVTTTKTDSFSGTLNANSELAITGLSVSITPSATSSQILVLASFSAGTLGNFVLKRGATNICIGDAAGNRDRVTASRGGTSSTAPNTIPIMFLDSPATTSATSYSISFVSANSNNVTVYCNRSETDTDSGDFARYASTITALEISA
jgi:hypothetical protein